jgi:hypothetical protein
MRVPRSAAPDSRVLGDVLAELGRAARRPPPRRRPAPPVRVGPWELAVRDGALVAVHDDGTATVLARPAPPAESGVS